MATNKNQNKQSSAKRPSPMITKAGYTRSGRRTASYGTKTSNR